MRGLLSMMLVVFAVVVKGQAQPPTGDFWEITNRQSIRWDISSGTELPHSDNIEMAGKKVAAILYYDVDEEGNLRIEKDIIFPQLRTFNKSNEPDWKKYRAYFRRRVPDDTKPTISCDKLIVVHTAVDSVEIDGFIRFYYSPAHNIKLTKTIFPSMDDRVLVEEWTLENTGDERLELTIANVSQVQGEQGYKGAYTFSVSSEAAEQIVLDAHSTYRFPIYYGATLNTESPAAFDLEVAKKSRIDFLNTCREQLVLDSSDEVLDMLFYFSKIRAAESIYSSSMGLVHSPGGGNYYVGIWANDQIEYSGPFFPYLGYDTGNTAAYNAYQMFARHTPEDSNHIAYAFEVDGNFPMEHLDRGDAAMIAYGTSQYLLNRGDLTQAATLWPLVEWSLAYCHRKRNAQGAVQSASDEMEGRIETGSANLSTSTLYYGGLKHARYIAAALGKKDLAAIYSKRMQEMGTVIENYFGATVEGLNTYKYYQENTLLRHWICLPLVMGIVDRKEATLTALFEKLWTKNGVLVENNPAIAPEDAVFWDRGTLYALRGAMKVGGTELGYQKLVSYSRKRLLGDHVPYAIEAYPENNMKHLSAESALYCRVIIEGLLGIEPTGFASFRVVPNLPKALPYLSLKQIYLAGVPVNITLESTGGKIDLRIQKEEEFIFRGIVNPGEPLDIQLPTE